MINQTNAQELVISIAPESSIEVQRPPERLPSWRECMAYGSERFETATANNHNIVMLVEAPVAQKVVLNKDVVLTLPQNPENLDMKAGYPTHQEAWLPLWYIAAYHSQAKTPQEFEYQREILSKVSPEDFALVPGALAYKAHEFLQEYNVAAKPLAEVAEDAKAIRKRFKPMTRVLQDIMLYADMPKQAIRNHDEFLQSSPIACLINQANALRRGEELDSAALLEQQMEQVISSFVQDCGGIEAAKQAYERLSNQLGSSENGSVYIVDKDTISIEQGPLYAYLINPSLTLAVDEHDQDVISVVPGLAEPKFSQIEKRFGKSGFTCYHKKT